MSCVLGVLVLGVSTLAHFTHAIPYTGRHPDRDRAGGPLRLRGGALGTAGLVFVQLATALVLYTGANTPFTGFPYLASFVAEDRFLPRQLTRRGHRLAFSNGIIALTVVALALLLVTARERGQAGGAVRDRGVHGVHDGRGGTHRVPLAAPRAAPAAEDRRQRAGGAWSPRPWS